MSIVIFIFIESIIMSDTNLHNLNHEINIKAPIDKIQKALATKDGLSSWNTKDVRGTGEIGSEWILTYGTLKFHWKILESNDNKVVWQCMEGPGESIGTIAEYIFTKISEDTTKVILAHSGWNHKEGQYQKCNTLWGALLFHLAKYVETSVSNSMHQ